MRRSGLVLMAVSLIASNVQSATALRPHHPIVVFQSSSTVSALPFYSKLKNQDGPGTPLPRVPGEYGVTPLEQRLPLRSARLRPGPPVVKPIQGLYQPLFIMGMDTASLQWFAEAADEISEIKARGIVVQAESLAAWRQLRDLAATQGIPLMLLEGDSLAQGYAITSYPILLVPPSLWIERERGG